MHNQASFCSLMSIPRP